MDRQEHQITVTLRSAYAGSVNDPGYSVIKSFDDNPALVNLI